MQAACRLRNKITCHISTHYPLLPLRYLLSSTLLLTFCLQTTTYQDTLLHRSCPRVCCPLLIYFRTHTNTLTSTQLAFQPPSSVLHHEPPQLHLHPFIHRHSFLCPTYNLGLHVGHLYIRHSSPLHVSCCLR